MIIIPISGWLRQYSKARSGPMTKKAVDRASAKAADGATTVVESTPSAG
jgi:hypothetical protein